MSESPLLHWLEWLELALYRHATRIVAVTHAFREDLARRGIPRDKIDVITNGVDLDGFAPRDRDQDLALSLGLEGCFVAGYIGTHGLAHGLRTLLDAAEQLRNEPDGKSIRLMMLGNGAEKGALVAEAGRRGLDNVVFFDSVPKSEVARYWALLDVAIIHLRKTELFTSVIPSKLFECMGMGIPVLHGVAGESAEIVRREEVGEVFESENANALVAALLRMRRDATLRARYAANGPSAARRYDRTQLARNMLNTIQMTGGR